MRKVYEQHVLRLQKQVDGHTHSDNCESKNTGVGPQFPCQRVLFFSFYIQCLVAKNGYVLSFLPRLMCKILH